MTTLATGASITVTAAYGSSIAVSTNGGLAQVVVTQAASTQRTVHLGPAPVRRIFGPYPLGAQLAFTNTSCDSLIYDAPGDAPGAITTPGQPAKPVLTAMAGAVSLAWTPGAAGSTATTSNIWTDINGNVTQLTTNPQVITAPAGTPYTGTVTTLNAQGAGPASVQADAVTPAAAALISNGAIVPGTSTANGFMSQATTRDSKRLQTIIRNQTPFTLVTAEQTSDNLTVNQPPVSSYVDLPPNTQNRIEGNGSKMWVGVKAIAPSSVSSSGTLCTIVFTAPHAMLTGDILTLIDFVPTGYNGQLYSVTVVNATTLTVNLAASAGAVTTMGKAFPRPITGVTIQTTTTP